jgi:phenylalanyl-tRNA synthetase beta chain
MRVPLSWLGDYVEIDLTPEALAERLTLLGMEVQSIERWGDDWRDVVVGELLAVERHPRADRLSLATVTVGAGETLEIVCGATNIAPGQRVPVALPGAVLPGGRVIERSEKMGVTSNGMLCSGDELRLTGDADGILILPANSPLGAPLAQLYGDVILDVDVKPNRGDALSMLGLAREVSAATGAPVRPPSVEVEEAAEPVDERLAVEVRDTHLCPRFVGRWVSGVRVSPSPDAVQMRLIAAGMRPVSNVVDASNYVMLELGKPIHTFDAAAVRGGRIVVRRAEPGERLETLDHVVRDLDPETLLIADPQGPLAIAGVMGGASSEVGGGTTDVIVESAIFDPVSIRRTGQRFGLRSEASLRFEKGQEFRLARIGADRTARLLSEWAGGIVALGRVDTAPNEPEPARVAFRPARVNRLLGAVLSTDEQRALLARVGVETEPTPADVPVPVSAGAKPLSVAAGAADALVAIVPTWRHDLTIEADLAEEIARVRGYETVPSTLPHAALPAYRPAPLEVRDAVREVLVGAGLTEVITHALVSPRHVETFRPAAGEPVVDGEEPAGGDPIAVTNPLSSQHSVLRQSLIGSLLDVVITNVRHGRTDVTVFEVGKGYGREGTAVREWWRLGLALTGAATPPHFADRPRGIDLDDVKGLVELVCVRLGFDLPVYSPLRADPLLHPGRSARVSATMGGRALGMAGLLGELHPSLLDESDVRVERVLVAELAVAGLGGGQAATVRATSISRHPAVERDVAVVLAEGTPAAVATATVERHAGSLLRSIRLFDIYRGAPLAPDEKSLAFRLVFGAPDRTLTDEEIDEAVAAVRRGLADELGGRPRV